MYDVVLMSLNVVILILMIVIDDKLDELKNREWGREKDDLK